MIKLRTDVQDGTKVTWRYTQSSNIVCQVSFDLLFIGIESAMWKCVCNLTRYVVASEDIE